MDNHDTQQSTRARVPTLGLGWAFPVRRQALAEGTLYATVSDEDAVVRSMALILGTERGERVMRPEFGSRLHRLLFAANSPATRAAAEFEVREALLRDEPRIDLLQVRASAAGERGELMLINIEYRVRSTDNRFNLVYPFYLDRASA
ncbi:GPW/gp25 family protein [Ideonella sp. YS5]|uniref:GPW/gp25 family protein n=1 Tax=Ideonella sp. YS5 TaxID=3453714 RepID=UPI003EEE64B3